jgi:hypothetical protein
VYIDVGRSQNSFDERKINKTIINKRKANKTMIKQKE